MGFLIHGPGGAVKLYFSVPVGMYTVFLRPGSTVHCILGTKNPGQNPGQKPGQKSGQKPGQKSGQKSGQNLAKIRACRPCIKNPTVGIGRKNKNIYTLLGE